MTADSDTASAPGVQGLFVTWLPAADARPATSLDSDDEETTVDEDDDVPGFGVYLGLDVGKEEHHA